MMYFLKDYRRPNDKIKSLRAEGILESIKKGLYIAGPNIGASKPEAGYWLTIYMAQVTYLWKLPYPTMVSFLNGCMKPLL
jgi:hypothetical protein